MELDKSFTPEKIEKKWIAFWEKSSLFQADPTSGKPPFCIIMPPPNVTGVLHMGHALVSTLSDIMTRFMRMQGYETLWLPGTDHAGISTQTVVERHLLQEEKKGRRDYTREEFIQKIWKWKELYETRILEQIKLLGCSCDFSRLRFTMDEKSSYAVKVLFKRMFDQGLIYQGDYLVNWDPIAETALSDDEVEYEEMDSFLWYLRYPLAGEKGYITVATTRPETLLGDTAVAVHPDDPRYSNLIGKKVQLPFVNRTIPIISDRAIDPQFGTGAVKITPAHDPNDYEMAHRHQLTLINILTPQGRVNEQGGTFEGLTREEARHNLIAQMKEMGLLEDIKPHKLRVGRSYRSKAIIEPYLSKQWFVKMSAFKDKLIALVKDKSILLEPPHFDHTYFHWIENLRDWCISRQIWWGHQIPIWYHKKDASKILCYIEEGLPPEVAQAPDEWRQDSDVLDTWFSSALWPLSTLGWPEESADLKKFYPTSLLITGHDILFFWVARMVLMGEIARNEVPFKNVFLHGLIFGKSYWRMKNGMANYVTKEEQKRFDLGETLPKDVYFKWEKMSKSKGNVIDPLEVSREYGTDAIRFALAASTTHARQIDLDRRRFEDYKNFVNKIWNGARFILMNLEGEHPLTSDALAEGINRDLLNLEDHWILSLLNKTIGEMNACLAGKVFDKAATTAYDFFWREFCSYYVEISKPHLFAEGQGEMRKNKQKILLIVLVQTLLLLHPIAPFITEEIASLLRERFPSLKGGARIDPYTFKTIEALHCPSLSIATYPSIISKKDLSPEIEERFKTVELFIYAVRNLRGELGIPIQEKSDLYLYGDPTHATFKLIQENRGILLALLKVDKLYFEDILSEPKLFGSTTLIDGIKLFVPLPLHLKQKEIERLRKEKEKELILIEDLTKRLEDSSFKEKAPVDVVQKMEKTKLEKQASLLEIERKLIQLERI